MNKLPIAAAGIVAMLTTSVLFAYAEPSEGITPAENDAVHYCRTHLAEEDQLLYDALLACALSEDPSEKGAEFQVRTDPAGDEFKAAFHRCYNALLFDHPELFWLYAGDSSFQYTYRRKLLDEGTYYIAFQLTGSFPERDAQLEALKNAADTFLSEIDLDQSAPQVALQIHDKLIDLVSYDREAAASEDRDLAHTAYGALVANSRGEANRAVCDGYSYAYEYLLQKAGIRSTVVAEEALDTETDYSEIAEEAMNNAWYTNRLTHYLFNVTTAQISFFEPGSRYRYTNDRGWVSFLGDSVHIRHSEDETDETGDYMTPLAPIAEGTEYSFDNLND